MRISSKVSSRAIAILCAIVLLSILGGVAQSQPLITIKRVNLTWPEVKVDFTVHCGNQLTFALQSANIGLREDGMPIPDVHLISPDPAVKQKFSVAFVLDATASMRGLKRNALMQAAADLAEDMDGVQDQGAVYWFNTTVTLAAPMTTDKGVVRQAIFGLPALDLVTQRCWDGLYDAVRHLADNGTNHYRTVILVVDGNDVNSQRVPAEILAAARASDIRICVLTYSPYFEDVMFCQDLATETGGLSFLNSPTNMTSLNFQEILSWLREGYRECRVSYSTTCKDGLSRKLELSALNVCGGYDTTVVAFNTPKDQSSMVPVALGVDDASTQPEKEIVLPISLRTSLPISYLYSSSFTLKFDTTLMEFRGLISLPTSIYPQLQASATASRNIISGSISTPLRFEGAGPLFGLRFYVRDHGTRNPVPTVVELTSWTIGRGCLVPSLINGVVTIQPTTMPRLACSTPHQGAIDLGSVELTKTSTKSITIRNAGGDRLQFTRTRIVGMHAGDFSFAQAPPAWLDPGQQATVTIRFAPTASGLRSGRLSMETNDPVRPDYFIDLNGTGVAIPRLTVSLSAIAFGSVGIGFPATRNLVVENTGTGPLTLAGQVFSGTHATDYSLYEPSSITLSVGQKDTVVVAFDPTAPGLRSAVLTFSSDDPVRPSIAVQLTGTGVITALPRIALNTTLLDFGTVPRNRDSVLMIRVANTGTADLHIGSQIISGAQAADFTALKSCRTVLPPLGVDTVIIRFAPQATGQRTATFTISSDDGQNPAMAVQLRGRGSANAQPKISLSVTELIYGTVDLGISLTKRFYVSNTGQAPLSITSQKLAGVDSSQFRFGHLCRAELQPGETDVVEVYFSPTTTGPHNASVVVTSNDPSGGTKTVTLRGTGGFPIVPTLSLSTMDLDFGSHPVGQSGQRTLIVRNLGTQPLQIQSQVIQGEMVEDFIVLRRLKNQIPALGSDTLILRFVPRFGGTRRASYDITSNDPKHAMQSVVLHGTGTQEGTPKVGVNGWALDFRNGTIGIGKTDSLIISNAGGGMLWLFRREITGRDASDFTIVRMGSDQIPMYKGSWTVIRFSPSKTGQRSAILHVESNDSLYLNFDIGLTGNGVTTGVSDGLAPTSFGITSIYPQPFAEDLTVRFAAPAAGRVRAVLLDALGRECMEKELFMNGAGVEELRMTVGGQPAGMYLIRLHFQDQIKHSPVLHVPSR